jgi:hypothetical protein
MDQGPTSSMPPQGLGTPAPQETGRRRNTAKVAAIAVVVVILGGLAYAAFRVFGGVAGTADVLDDKLPARSLFYATAYLDPGAGQKINLEALADKFPALAGRDLGQTVNQGLDAISAQSGLLFSRDIEPWLGTQIAVAFEPPSGPEAGFVFLADSKDDERARAGLSTAELSPAFSEGATWKSETYRGVELRVGEFGPGISSRAYAVVEHTVVVSNELDLVHEVIDTIQGRGSSLAEDATYRDTVEDLPDSVLGFAYANLRQALNIFGPGGGFNLGAPRSRPPSFLAAAGDDGLSPQISNPFAGLQAFEGFGLTLSAQPGGFELDFALDLDPSKLSPEQRAALENTGSPDAVLKSVPGRAFGVLALSNFKDLVQTFADQALENPVFGGIANQLDLRSVVEALSGEAALEVGPAPNSPAGGALLVGTDDPPGMERFLDKVATQVVEGSGPSGSVVFRTEEYKGVTIHFTTNPFEQDQVTPAYAVANGFGIIATSPDDVKAVIDAHEGSNIADSPTFGDARDQVPEGPQLIYVDVQALLSQFGPQLSQSIGGSFSSIVEPNLRPIKALIMTTSQAEDATLTHLFLLIR